MLSPCFAYAFSMLCLSILYASRMLPVCFLAGRGVADCKLRILRTSYLVLRTSYFVLFYHFRNIIALKVECDAKIFNFRGYFTYP